MHYTGKRVHVLVVLVSACKRECTIQAYRHIGRLEVTNDVEQVILGRVTAECQVRIVDLILALYVHHYIR